MDKSSEVKKGQWHKIAFESMQTHGSRFSHQEIVAASDTLHQRDQRHAVEPVGYGK
jgi:hypothetical protein